MLARKRLFLFLLFILPNTIFFLFSPSWVTAADVTEDKSWAVYPPEEFAQSVDKSFNNELEGKSYAGLFIENSRFYGWSCMIIGVPCSNDETRQQSFMGRSALGITTKFIASTYAYPVASTGYYLADLGTRLGIPSSYAQGIGFGGLRPILSLWKSFRNVAYILLIVVLIAIGFMVMFRMKIDPRTVITVQAALPRIVITLLLITFSYAIAGFLIDLMYLVILIAISVVMGSGIMPPPPGMTPGQFTTSTQAWYLTGGTSALFSQTFGAIPQDALNDLKWWLVSAGIGAVALKGISLLPGITFPLSIFGGLSAFFTQGLGMLLLGGLLGGALTGFIGGGGGSGALSGAFNPLLLIIVALGLLFMFIRLFFLLLNAYIQVLIGVIFAPIQLLFDALPTTGGNFSRWIRNLIANLAVFPMVIILLLVGRAISTSLGNAEGPESPLWTPPLVPAWSKDAAQFIIGFGVITLIPTLVGGLKELLKAKPVLPIGIGAPLSPFISGAQTALGVGQQFYYGKIGLEALGGLVGRGGGQRPATTP